MLSHIVNKKGCPAISCLLCRKTQLRNPKLLVDKAGLPIIRAEKESFNVNLAFWFVEETFCGRKRRQCHSGSRDLLLAEGIGVALQAGAINENIFPELDYLGRGG